MSFIQRPLLFGVHGSAGDGRAALPAWVRTVLGSIFVLVILVPLLSKVSPVANVPKWDEFIYVYDAQRILSGQVPYRDFFQFTPPAHFFILAAFFKLFGGGASLTLGRYVALLEVLAAWALVWRALRRASWPRPDAAVFAALLPAAFYPFWAIPSHHWLACLLFAAAFEAYDFAAGAVRGLRGWAFLGVMAGLGFLTLQTVFLGLIVFWGTLLLLSGGRRLKSGAAFLFGFAAGAAPLMAWLAWEGALPALFRDAFLWTAAHYQTEGGVNAVPLLADLPDRMASLWSGAFGGVWLVQVVSGSLVYVGLTGAAIGVLGLFFAGTFRAVSARRFSSPLAAGAMAFTAVSLALFLRGKSDWLHLIFILPQVGLVWVLALGSGVRARAASSMVLKALAMGLLAAAVIFHSKSLVVRWPAGWELLDVDRTTREAPVNRWLRSQPWLEPADTLAAFPEGGEVYLYVRPAAVGFTLLLSPRDGYQSEDQYALAARQIVANKARCIILTSEQEAEYLTPGPLADVLHAAYEQYSVVGDAVIYRRRISP